MNTAGSVLLDTNVVVAHFRNDPNVTARLRATPATYVPWIVLGELHYGALRAAVARQFDLPLATRDGHFAAVPRLTTIAW